jgi:FAD binding domain-containing protein
MATNSTPSFELVIPTKLAGKLIQPGDPGWDRARTPWNLAIDQRPAAVGLPETAADVADLVALAAEHDLRVAAQGTGHSAAPLGSLEDTILVRTERMRGIAVDPERRLARVEAGVVWLDVVNAAAAHGLAALAGSSPDVGVVGYSLGGGISWLGRTYGLAASNVTAIELVTGDGRVVRADAETEPDLFWALRGGGGSFGVVTAIELRLLPVTEVYAGILWYPIERGLEVLTAWGELAARTDLPDGLTTVGRFLKLPPIEDIPEPVRGKSFVVVEVIHLGDRDEADALLLPLRGLGPAMDTLAKVPVTELSRLHMDPDHPVPGVGDGILLDAMPQEAIEAFVAAAGADSPIPLLSAEIRQLGGELGRARPQNGALASIDAGFALFAVGIAPTPEAGAAVAAGLESLRAQLAPWTAERMYLNFAETRRDAASFWPEQAYRRLRRVKAAFDPQNRIRGNQPLAG